MVIETDITCAPNVHVIHDAGKGSDAAFAGLGALLQTLTEVLPEYDYQKQTFNTSALLGEMGADTPLTDVVLAIGHTNHLARNTLGVGTTDAEHLTAVVAAPPAKLNPIDPNAAPRPVHACLSGRYRRDRFLHRYQSALSIRATPVESLVPDSTSFPLV